MQIQMGGKNADKYAICDKEYYPVLSRYRWRLDGRGYVRTNFRCEHMADLKTGQGTVLMHQMVMNLSEKKPDVCLCDSSYAADYGDGIRIEINHKKNKLDNGIENLEYMTGALNNSTKGDRSGQSSIYNGVYWDEDCKKWKAYYYLDGRTKPIGYFFDEIEAARSHDRKCRSLGLDRMFNFPVPEKIKIPIFKK